MAKFARPPVERDRIGFSTGIAMVIDEDTESTSVWAFPVEAGLGVSFGDRYDLGFSVGHLMGTAEGNFALIDSDVRLGILHGVGLGLFASQDDQALLPQLTGGAFLQLGRRTPFFWGVKATRGFVVGTDTVAPTTFLTSTLGFLPRGRIKVVPELALQRANYTAINEDGEDDPTVNWTVVIGVTVMMHYFAPGML